MNCPIRGCGHIAITPVRDIEPDIQQFPRIGIKAYTDAVADALLLHVREDHIGHSAACPRASDLASYCDCHVHAD
jgi:hypothetical protein